MPHPRWPPILLVHATPVGLIATWRPVYGDFTQLSISFKFRHITGQFEEALGRALHTVRHPPECLELLTRHMGACVAEVDNEETEEDEEWLRRRAYYRAQRRMCILGIYTL